MFLTTLFGVFMLIVGAAAFFVLVRGGHTERIDLIGWAGATLSIISSAMILIGVAAEAGVLEGAVIFAATLACLAALAGGIVWWIRKPRQHDTTPKQSEVHAYGSYTAADVRAARATAQQARRGVRS